MPLWGGQGSSVALAEEESSAPLRRREQCSAAKKKRAVLRCGQGCSVALARWSAKNRAVLRCEAVLLSAGGHRQSLADARRPASAGGSVAAREGLEDLSCLYSSPPRSIYPLFLPERPSELCSVRVSRIPYKTLDQTLA